MKPTTISVSSTPQMAERREIVEVEGRTPQNIFMVELFTTIVTVIIAITNIAADYFVYLTIAATADSAANMNLPNTISSAGMVATYNNLADLDKPLHCDAVFFSTEEGHQTLVHRLSLLESWCFSLWCVSFIPVALTTYLKLKLLWDRFFSSRRRSLAFDPIKNPEAPYIGTTSAEPFMNKVRRERFQLREEVNFYMLTQVVQDVPQIMIIMLFGMFVYGHRGERCGACFLKQLQGDITKCPVEAAAFIGNSPVIISLGVHITNIIWNFGQLMQKYYMILRAWLPKYSVTMIYMKIFLTTAIYAAAVMFPISLLFYFYIGPYLLDYSEDDLNLYWFGMIFGGGLYLIGFVSLTASLFMELEEAAMVGTTTVCAGLMSYFCCCC